MGPTATLRHEHELVCRALAGAFEQAEPEETETTAHERLARIADELGRVADEHGKRIACD